MFSRTSQQASQSVVQSVAQSTDQAILAAPCSRIESQAAHSEQSHSHTISQNTHRATISPHDKNPQRESLHHKPPREFDNHTIIPNIIHLTHCCRRHHSRHPRRHYRCRHHCRRHRRRYRRHYRRPTRVDPVDVGNTFFSRFPVYLWANGVPSSSFK